MLEEIVAYKRRELREQRANYPLHTLLKQIPFIPAARDFSVALTGEEIKVIAEIKRASPSHGYFFAPFLQAKGVAETARVYEEAGAAVISVLTERKFFGGSSADLKEVKRAINIPVLRKDFIVDEYQIYESRVWGADAVLLIASLLGYEKLKRFLALARETGMGALVEVGEVEEAAEAVDAGAEVIGINNRNLKTMKIDLNRTLKIARHIPPGTILVSESGINTAAGVKMLRDNAPVDAVLVGKSLVTAPDPYGKLRELAAGGGS